MENKRAAPVCETGAAGNPASEWKEMTLQDAVDMLLDMRFCVEFDFDTPKNLRKRYAIVNPARSTKKCGRRHRHPTIPAGGRRGRGAGHGGTEASESSWTHGNDT